MMEPHDPSGDLVLDGNALAGILHEVFGKEMTTSEAKCASCGTVSRLAGLLVFGGTMGNVMRCPHCQDVMMRIVSQPESFWLNMQGVSYLKQDRFNH